MLADVLRMVGVIDCVTNAVTVYGPLVGLYVDVKLNSVNRVAVVVGLNVSLRIIPSSVDLINVPVW